ncbi:MAG: hypothetical protein B7Z20_10750 [Sphingobium sp. 32-64-5]|nr:MAG: hypothetical protein B7Z20_10750 [Sphingobium sp. 32-64-5]
MFVIDVAQSKASAEIFCLALSTKDRVVRHGGKGRLHSVGFGGSNSRGFNFCLGSLDRCLLDS